MSREETDLLSENQRGRSSEDKDKMILEGRSGAKSHSALLSVVEDLFLSQGNNPN